MATFNDNIKVYGALSVVRSISIFFDDDGFWKDFYRNGKHIATAHYDNNGNRDFLQVHKESNPTILTRAKGFRYWKKYLRNFYYWDLPKEMQIAVDLPCVSEGTFYDKNGELCGYCG